MQRVWPKCLWGKNKLNFIGFCLIEKCLSIIVSYFRIFRGTNGEVNFLFLNPFPKHTICLSVENCDALVVRHERKKTLWIVWGATVIKKNLIAHVRLNPRSCVGPFGHFSHSEKHFNNIYQSNCSSEIIWLKAINSWLRISLNFAALFM